MPESPIDIASPAGRLRRLHLLSLRAEREGNGSLAARCIEMAAREQDAQRAGGGNHDAFDMTPDEARQVIADFLAGRDPGKERDETGSESDRS